MTNPYFKWFRLERVNMKFSKLIIYICISIVLSLTTMMWRHWPTMLEWADKHAGTASWVQAFFSVGAILITTWTVNHAHVLQVKYDAQLKFDDYTQFLENVFQLTGAVGMVAKKIHKLLLGASTKLHEDLGSMAIELEGLERAVNGIDLSRLDRHEFILGVHVASCHARKLIETIKRNQNPNFSPILEGPLLQNAAHKAELEVTEALRPLKLVIDKRGYHAPQDIRPN